MRLMSKGLWVLPTIYIPLITLFAEANKTIPSVTKKVNVAVIAPDFHREVRPILESTCIQCHGIEKQKGGLRLDTLANAKKGGDSGSALIPGNLEDSLLLDRIFLPADDDEIMPPENGPLSPAQQDILKRWIKAGGHWPQGVQLFPHSERELALRNIANNKKLVELAVHPAQISLSTKEDFNSFVIVAKYDDDITRDVTRESTLSLSNNSVVRMENNLIYPLKDGNSTLTVSFQNRKIELPIMVQDAMVERPVSFNLDVMPVFLKAGCNTGSCITARF